LKFPFIPDQHVAFEGNDRYRIIADHHRQPSGGRQRHDVVRPLQHYTALFGLRTKQNVDPSLADADGLDGDLASSRPHRQLGRVKRNSVRTQVNPHLSAPE
jgi:hypothetical protein